jgi:hypothetical protein
MARVNPSGGVPHSNPSAEEMEARLESLNRVDPRNRLYGFRQGAVEDAYRLARRSSVDLNNQTIAASKDLVNESFASGLPISSSRGEFATTTRFGSTLKKYGPDSDVSQAYALLEDRPEAAEMGFDVTSGTYYEPTSYQNLAGIPMQRTNGPAPITQRPTSTSNPRRPRTVAAGYDRDKKVLTIVFRDGTFYNYYEVSEYMWNTFKMLPSKGAYIKRYLDKKPRGEADLSFATKQAQELLYRVSRTNQILYQGNEMYRPRRQPKLESRLPKATGRNPSKGGRNPATKRRKP